MKILSSTKRSEFIFAPYNNTKIISPIKIKDGVVDGGIKIKFEQLYFAQKLKQQLGLLNNKYSTKITGHPTTYNEYMIDPISSYIHQFGSPSKKLDFSGIIEYNPIDNSSFCWEVDDDVKCYEFESPSSVFTEKPRIFGVSLNPGFIVVIGDQQQKIMILTLMGSENEIIGRSRKHSSILKQFELIQRLWPELDISSEISSQSQYITYRFRAPQPASEEARIIFAIRDNTENTIWVGETHKPNNSIIEQFDLK